MADTRRLALERWREEKRRQKETKHDLQKNHKVSFPVRRVILHRSTQKATNHTHMVTKQCEIPVLTLRRVSRESNLLAPNQALDTRQKLLFKTPAKRESDTEVDTDKTTSTISFDSVERGVSVNSNKKRRRRSYLSPISNAPSLAGGAQRVLTPAQSLLGNESDDDGGMDEDTGDTTSDIGSDPRHVSALLRHRKSDEADELAMSYKTEQDRKEGTVFSRDTISIGAIDAVLRVPQALLGKENKTSESDARQEPQLSPALLQAKKKLQQLPAVRASSMDYDDSADKQLEVLRAKYPLDFSDCVPSKLAHLSPRTSIDLKASYNSVSPRTLLDDTKSVQLLSDKLAQETKWEVGNFIVTKNLGQGKFGNVYLAKQKCTNSFVALKVLFKSPVERNCYISNLSREVEIQVRLCHPNVLSMHGYFHDSSCIYLVLEYAPYGELYKELAREKYFSDDMAAHYVAQVVEALKYCHSCNVIHRDIKPENLLLGYNKTIKLADFGWSVHAPKPYNFRKTFCGTPDYLSPEIILGEPYDYQTDLWSLGVLTYELLIGSTPFYCANQMEMYERIQLVDYHFPPSPLLSDSAKSFIAGLLKRRPSDRMRLVDASKHSWIRTR